jgi:hypothetical protein
MRGIRTPTALAPLLTLAAVTLAACGSTAKTTTTTAATTPSTPPPPAASTAPAAPAASGPNNARVPSRTLTASLSGPGGSTPPKPGSGAVTVRVNGPAARICWHFGALVGVPHPISASIVHSKYAGSPVVMFGAHYHASGCTTDPADVAAIVRTPSAYAVQVSAAVGAGTVTAVVGALEAAGPSTPR